MYVSSLCTHKLRHYSRRTFQPDLPVRIKRNIPLTVGDRNTYYTILSPKGYIDYPFASAFAGLGVDLGSWKGVVQSGLAAAAIITAGKYLWPILAGRK